MAVCLFGVLTASSGKLFYISRRCASVRASLENFAYKNTSFTKSKKYCENKKDGPTSAALIRSSPTFTIMHNRYNLDQRLRVFFACSNDGKKRSDNLIKDVARVRGEGHGGGGRASFCRRQIAVGQIAVAISQ